MAKQEQGASPIMEAIMSGQNSPEIERMKLKILELEAKRLELELQQGAEYRAKQIAVADISIQRHTEEERKKNEEQSQMRRMQEEGAKSSLQSMRMMQKVQAACPHLHEESNRPTTVGVRLMSGQITINCGRCGMVDTGSRQELVMKYGNIFPKDEAIGGPLPPGAAELLGMTR